MSKFLYYSRDDSIRFGNIAILAFIFLQILDGVLTYLGVYFDYSSEANPAICFIISVAGLGPGLVIAKTLPTVCGLFLYYHGRYTVIVALTIFYVLFTTIPWLMVFLGLI